MCKFIRWKHGSMPIFCCILLVFLYRKRYILWNLVQWWKIKMCKVHILLFFPFFFFPPKSLLLLRKKENKHKRLKIVLKIIVKKFVRPNNGSRNIDSMVIWSRVIVHILSSSQFIIIPWYPFVHTGKLLYAISMRWTVTKKPSLSFISLIYFKNFSETHKRIRLSST